MQNSVSDKNIILTQLKEVLNLHLDQAIEYLLFLAAVGILAMALVQILKKFWRPLVLQTVFNIWLSSRIKRAGYNKLYGTQVVKAFFQRSMGETKNLLSFRSKVPNLMKSTLMREWTRDFFLFRAKHSVYCLNTMARNSRTLQMLLGK